MKQIFLALILSIGLSACKPVLQEPTASNQTQDEGEALYEKCRHEENQYGIVKCIGYHSALTNSYMELHLSYYEPNPEAAWDYMRLEALHNIFMEQNKNKIRLYALKKALPDKEGFITLFENAIIWAKQEAAQSAEELYLRSKNIANDVSEGIPKENFKELFLYMAETKGHAQAAIEAEIMSKALLKSLEEEDAK